MKKIFITRKIPDVGITMLRDKGYSITLNENNSILGKEELASTLKKDSYDGVLSLLTDIIDKDIFDAAPSAKIFANYAVGFNNIDVEEAKRRGIIVTNTPGMSAESVAEHTFAMLLALTCRIAEGDRFMRAGKYKGWDPELFLSDDISGKTLGILGAGKIGTQVAYHAWQGFGMNIIYYDVVRNEAIEKKCGAKFVPNVEDVLRNADMVSLHVPLLDSTHHLINADRLKLMKKSACLVNTSRGPVIDEQALVEALRNNVIRGAALDVYEFEPSLAPGLTELENVVLTPHIASGSFATRNEMATIAAQNIIDYFEGRKPKNAVY